LNKLLCKHHNLNVFNSQTESISKAKQTCHSHRPATSTSQHFVVSPVGRLARRIAYSSSACKNFRSRHRPKQPKRPRRVTSVQERTSLIGSRDWPAARRDKRFAAIDLPSKCPRHDFRSRHRPKQPKRPQRVTLNPPATMAGRGVKLPARASSHQEFGAPWRS